MALLNALKAGTYSTVRVTRYNKHGKEKELRFIVDIYEDDTKNKLITSIEKVIDDIRVDETRADWGSNDAPANPSLGDRVTVGLAPTGDFANRNAGTILEWSANAVLDANGDPVDGWSEVGKVSTNAVIRVESENKTYLVTDGVYEELVGWVGPIEWDLYFNVSSYSQANKNLITGIYDYLKTTPEFANAIDS